MQKANPHRPCKKPPWWRFPIQSTPVQTRQDLEQVAEELVLTGKFGCTAAMASNIIEHHIAQATYVAGLLVNTNPSIPSRLGRNNYRILPASPRETLPNAVAAMPKSPPAGIYAPLPVFFTNDDELDLDAYTKHAQYVAASGVLPVASASIGEAAHLDRSERIKVIKTLRDAINAIDLHDTPIVAGVGAPSTRETIQLARDAAASGAEFVLLVPPGYYAGLLKANPAAMRKFFVDVAAAAPVPVIIYNYPAVASGIDLESEDVVAIAKAAPNICGIMLSCGSVGKLARITTTVDNSSFTTLAGFIDFLLPSICVGSAGAISPLPNIAPAFCIKLWQASRGLDKAADRQFAKELQGLAALGEAAMIKKGLPGLKQFLHRQFGYPAAPRLPLPLMGDVSAQLAENQHIKDIMELEKDLH